MTVLEISLSILSLIIIFWIVSFLFLNDFFVKSVTVKNKKILVIYPHPDDEILTVGGVMTVNKNTTLLILTKGERGTPDAYLDLNLKSIRTKEEQRSSKILKVKKLINTDYGDGELENKRDEVKKEIEKAVKREKPDLVITYDRSGFYGHPDHMVVSEIVTDLVKNKFRNIELWYATVPKKIYDLLKVPDHMAKDKDFKNKRTYPTHKVFVGINVLSKVRAAIVHKSQYKIFQGGLPLPIPSAFFQSMMVFEYFYKVT